MSIQSFNDYRAIYPEIITGSLNDIKSIYDASSESSIEEQISSINITMIALEKELNDLSSFLSDLDDVVLYTEKVLNEYEQKRAMITKLFKVGCLEIYTLKEAKTNIEDLDTNELNADKIDKVSQTLQVHIEHYLFTILNRDIQFLNRTIKTNIKNNQDGIKLSFKIIEKDLNFIQDMPNIISLSSQDRHLQREQRLFRLSKAKIAFQTIKNALIRS